MHSYIVGKLEGIIQQRLETAATVVDPIESELESYRRELEAKKKVKTSSASQGQAGKSVLERGEVVEGITKRILG